MRVVILGSAAGGGFPQWNCGCRNCRSLRLGTFCGKARTQTQVAVSADGGAWFLLNAGPDLRLQIEATPQLHPRDGNRDSPIAGVVLSSADLDQIAGLLSLRELQPFHIYCTRELRTILREENSVFAMLNRIPEQACWREIRPGENFTLQARNADTGMACEPISLGSRYPAYVRAKGLGEGASLGLILTSPQGRRLGYFPAVPALSDSLLRKLETLDVLLFDGTFWSDDELIRVQGGGATAAEMGHVPVSGPNGSLSRLAGLRKPRRIFVHVNNTNPILDESSPEHHQVRDAGWEVAEDGWQLEL